MREGVSFIIHESRALGETSRAIIRKCCMLKSQNNRGVLELVAAVKTKGKENRKRALGPGGLLRELGPNQRKEMKTNLK